MHQLKNSKLSAGGGEDYLALYNFVVKVAVFMQAGAQSSGLSEDVVNALFSVCKGSGRSRYFPFCSKILQIGVARLQRMERSLVSQQG